MSVKEESSVEDRDSHFKEGEKVLAYHGPRIYEAKIQKAEFRKTEWKYFVHYLGWSKNWDEWIGIDRLLPHTPQNLEKQKDIDKDERAEKRSTKGRISQKKAAKGRKRNREEREEVEPSQRVLFPADLMKQLKQEHDMINSGKLVKLPRNPNVEEIFKRYLDSKRSENAAVEKYATILNGIRAYFDKALPLILLYNQEREQYKGVFSGNSKLTPCSIYGAEHLLRLFVKLPELHLVMEEEALQQLHQKLTDFLRFIQKNQSSFFASGGDSSSKPANCD